MFLILDESNLIIYIFNEQPKFRNGYLAFPVIALDVYDTNTVVEADDIPFEFVSGAISYINNDYVIINQELYDKELLQRSKELVPQIISKLQAMKLLKIMDKWTLVKAELEKAGNEDMNDEWLLSNELNRTYPFVLDMATLLSFSETDLDQFFIEASKL